jgi:serine/threonine-protein kinase
LIGSLIGEGGMGVVYAATHLGLAAPVAVKLIRTQLKDDPEFLQRFLNEARAAASLKGEHVATVHDVGQLPTGEPYLVMERLDGIELDIFIEEHAPLAQSEAVDLVLEACAGLAEAHAIGLVHRDIKPSNLFLSTRADGQSVLKILDFGISKRLVHGSRKGLTNPDRSLGSPWYMSPEQMTNASLVDQRADIWSLGILLFQLLTRSLPFDGEDVPEVCAKVLTTPAPSLRRLRENIDGRLEEVVLRCLEKNPEDRYANVTALADALRPLSSGVGRHVPLAFARTEPLIDTNSARRRARTTLGSLAAVAARLKIRRKSHLPAFVVTALGVGLSLGWFGWTHPETLPNVERLAARVLSEVRLPGDPTLAPDPVDAPPEHTWSASQAIVRLDSTSLGPPGAERSVEPPEPSLTREEIQRRRANYQDWLRAHGLQRIGDVVVVDHERSSRTVPLDSDTADDRRHEVSE